MWIAVRICHSMAVLGCYPKDDMLKPCLALTKPSHRIRHGPNKESANAYATAKFAKLLQDVQTTLATWELANFTQALIKELKQTSEFRVFG